MAESSIPPPPPPPHALAQIQEDLKYLYASNTNVSNFVSVKLSNDRNYHLWETQMFCLLETYNLHSIVDATFISARALSPEIEKQYNSLIKGWIFGSISEELLGTVVNLGSAKEVWNKLKSFYDPAMISSQQGKSKEEAETETKDIVRVPTERETENIDDIPPETRTQDVDMGSRETKTEDKDNVPVEEKTEGKQTLATESKGEESIFKELKIKVEDTNMNGKNNITRNKELLKAIVQGRWWQVESTLREDKAIAKEAINSDGNTMLHIAVGIGRNNLVTEILSQVKDIELPKMVNLDGSTALHIAAIVGNTEAAALLIKKCRRLLNIPDHKDETPLDKAYENMHLDTIVYLLKAANDDGKPKKKNSSLEDSFVSPGINVGVNLLVNAVSAKQYDLATELVIKFPEFVVENDNVLMGLAKTFPVGLDYWETLIYPTEDNICERIVRRTWEFVEALEDYYDAVIESIQDIRESVMENVIKLILLFIFGFPLLIIIWIYLLIRLLILMIYFPLFMCYFFLWKIATRVVAPIKHIHKKKKEWEEGRKFLILVCDEIDKLEFPGAHARFYTRPILEAARQNAYEVVDEILMRSPEAIRYKDKSGYDIIQLAVIHRSEKIYNLIYVIGERSSVYRMIEDSSKNNMLHLAGRLAPSHKLKSRSGAALQLQRELQWCKEVEKIVFPSYITKENIFMETPEMVFTKEHANLVKEGEKWMKAVAESCSITAALITTIVFAAAITVPGGSNQTTGIPVFTGNFAFTIFAISDAISLFASSTSLLMFLSILTGRFAEQDFLVSLPKRLIIGLCTLMLSTSTMTVAFGATLYLVFCHKEPWMIPLICVLASLPIASFGTLQMPLIVDLFRSTYVRIFGKQSNHNNHRFNPDHIRLFFGK